MNDDFNTPKAIAAIFDFNKEVNTLLASERPLGRGTLAAIDGLYRELGGKVLGIIPNDLTHSVGGDLIEKLVDVLLGIRQQYRDARAWEHADHLRRQLADIGILVDDRPEGTVWRLERGGE
jgi:cysteinyl-tRNA synthetase